MQFLLALKTLLGLFPLVIEGIKLAETAFPNAKAGQEKLAVVKDMVQHAYSVSNDATMAIEQIAPAVDLIARSAVAVYNKTGVFKTTP